MIIDALNKVLNFVLDKVAQFLPNLSINDDFLNALNSAVDFFKYIIEMGGFLVDLHVVGICIGLMIAVDLFILSARTFQFVIKVIRG
jgi:hypothetical protein